MKNLFFFILLGIHLSVLTQITFTAWPEMLSYPYLLSNGFTLYKDFIHPYPPLLTFTLFGIFGIFGYSVITLKIFTWVLIILTDTVLYLILKKVSGEKLGLVFLGLYIPVQSFLDGNMLWFDYATVLPLLTAYLFFINWLTNRKIRNLFFIGMAFSAAIAIKQVSVLYVINLVIVYLLFIKNKKSKEVLVGLSGGIIFALPFITYIFITGALENFWLWTTYYPFTEWSNFPGYVDLKVSFREFLLLSLLGVPLLGGFIVIKSLIKNSIFISTSLFFIAAFITIYPRFSFFHFQPAFAFLTILLAIICLHLREEFKRGFIFFCIAAYLTAIFLVPKNFSNEVRFYSESDKVLMNKILQIKDANERIFLLGPISSQYVFTQTLPPQNWSDNFGWYLEIPGVQEWVLEGFIKNPPKIIFKQSPLTGSWYDLGIYQPKEIVDYIKMHYDKKEEFNNIEVWTRKD